MPSHSQKLSSKNYSLDCNISAPPEINQALDIVAGFLKKDSPILDEKTLEASRLARHFFRHFECLEPTLSPEQRDCRQRFWKVLLQVPFESLLRDYRLKPLTRVSCYVVKPHLHEIDQATNKILNFMNPEKKHYLKISENLKRACRIFAIAGAHLPYLEKHFYEKTKSNLLQISQRLDPLLKQGFEDEETRHYCQLIQAIFKQFSDTNSLIESKSDLEELKKFDEEDEKRFSCKKVEVKSKVVHDHLCMLLEMTTSSFVHSLNDEEMRTAVATYFKQVLTPSSSTQSKSFDKWLETFIPFFINNGHLTQIIQHGSETIAAILSHEKTPQKVDEWIINSLFPLYFSQANRFSEEGKQIIMSWFQTDAATVESAEKSAATEEAILAHQREIVLIHSIVSSLLKDYCSPLIQSAARIIFDMLKFEQHQLTGVMRRFFSSLVPDSLGKTEEIFETILPICLDKHFPIILDDLLRVTLDVLEDQPLRTSLEKWLLETMTPNLLRERKTELSPIPKKLTLSTFRGLEIFFRHFNQAIKHATSDFQQTSNLLQEKSDHLEKQIIRHMNRLSRKENLPIIVPENFDEAELQQNMTDQIKDLLHLCLPKPLENEEGKRELLVSLLSSVLQKVSDRVFSPEAILILLDKLLYDEFSLSPFKEEASRLQDPLHIDEKFTRELGTVFSDLAQHAIRIGSEGESFITKLSHSYLIDILMYFFKDKLAKGMHHRLHHIFTSSITFTPFVFLDQLLYTIKEGEKVPTLSIFLTKEDRKLKEIQSKIEKTIKNNVLYDFLNQKIKDAVVNKKGGVWPTLVVDSPRLERIFTNLGERAQFLLHHPLLLKVLFGYLLGHVKKELKGLSHDKINHGTKLSS